MINIDIDYKTLMELIGKDNGVQIKIRKGIVENFAKARLKTLFNDDIIKIALKEAKKTLYAETLQIIEQELLSGNYSFPVLNDKSKKAIKNYIDKIMYDEVNAQATDFKDYINKKFKEYRENYSQQMEKVIDKIINQEFENRIQEEVIKRINAVKTK